MRLLGVRFEDDGMVIVDYLMENEQSKFGGMAHSMWVSLDAQEKYESIEYYVKELREDAASLLEAFLTRDHT
jgi:hypothetical protein